MVQNDKTHTMSRISPEELALLRESQVVDVRKRALSYGFTSGFFDALARAINNSKLVSAVNKINRLQRVLEHLHMIYSTTDRARSVPVELALALSKVKC
jgi:hypothetical protein